MFDFGEKTGPKTIIFTRRILGIPETATASRFRLAFIASMGRAHSRSPACRLT
jgi:hypothetical protein